MKAVADADRLESEKGWAAALQTVAETDAEEDTQVNDHVAKKQRVKLPAHRLAQVKRFAELSREHPDNGAGAGF